MNQVKEHTKMPKTLSNPRGVYRIAYLPSGPAMTADEHGHMEPMFGQNYYVTERSEGEGVTDEERLKVKNLANDLLEQKPSRTLVIQVEHDRLFD
mgnify:CR=1 FL=1